MPKTKISEFSATPGNNTDIDGINIAEGCAPSGINDAIRELMAQLKDFQAGTAGDSFNGPVGTTTAAAGAFTTLSASGTVSGAKVGVDITQPAAALHVAGDSILSDVNVVGASYDSVSFSVAGQETNPNGIFFSPDGTKMFVIGTTGDDVNEYTLSTPWVVSTATYVTVFSVAAQDTSPTDIFFRADGLKMYVVGGTNDTVYQYALTTPWSIATASYESKSFSVAAQDASPTGLFFKPDGLSMYVLGTGSDNVYQYTLSTAWDVTTASYVQSLSVSGQDTAPAALSFTLDGSRMLVLGATGDDINQYNLTTPWNISTATFINVFSIAAQETTPTGLYIKPDGTKMYVVGTTNDTVYQYTVPSIAINLTGSTSVNGSATVQQDLTVYGTSSIGSITLSSGTANGVAYLNGSKVVTTGSALTFDGQTLTNTRDTPILTLNDTAASNVALRLLSTGGVTYVQSGISAGAFSPIAFTANGGGSEQMRLTSTGLGVGTTSPAVKLDVVGTTTSGLRLRSSSGAANGFNLYNDSSTDIAYLMNFYNGSMVFGVNNAEQARLTSTGLGIGTSSPSYKLDVAGIARSDSWIGRSNTSAPATDAFVYRPADNTLAFGTASTECARITSAGNLLVGTVNVGAGVGSTFRNTVVSASGSDGLVVSCSSAAAANIPLALVNTATSGDNVFSIFYTEASPTIRGNITYNRAGGLTAYNTTSDYRAKDILGPVANPGATIDALKVYEGQMKGATQSRPMLVAHEAQAVAPYSVTGEKDAVNDDGTPKYQQMDVSSLVPLLIAEIQSLRARVAALEAQP